MVNEKLSRSSGNLAGVCALRDGNADEWPMRKFAAISFRKYVYGLFRAVGACARRCRHERSYDNLRV